MNEVGVPTRDQPRSALAELASGIDALYLSGRCEAVSDLTGRLAHRRLSAEKEGKPLPEDFGGVEFELAPHGWGKYPYVLSHESGLVGVSPSSHLPTFRVQPRAEALHAIGPGAVVNWFGQLTESECGPTFWSTSRLDLFSDWQGWVPTGDDRDRFVCRATLRDTHEDSDQWTGFEFGRRRTKTICARIYDKTVQTKKKGLDWWGDVWGPRYDDSQSVVRVEFEIGRQGLKEFGIDQPTEAIDQMGRLWASVTEDWLTLRQPTSDQTRARWPIAAEWRQIQQAKLREHAIGLERVRAGKRNGTLRTIMPGLVGYLANFGAITENDTIADVVHELPLHVRNYELRRQLTFSDMVAERREERRRR